MIVQVCLSGLLAPGGPDDAEYWPPDPNYPNQPGARQLLPRVWQLTEEWYSEKWVIGTRITPACSYAHEPERVI